MLVKLNAVRGMPKLKLMMIAVLCALRYLHWVRVPLFAAARAACSLVTSMSTWPTPVDLRLGRRRRWMEVSAAWLLAGEALPDLLSPLLSRSVSSSPAWMESLLFK